MPFFQMIGLLMAFLLIAGVGGVLSAGLAIPLAVGANAAGDNSMEVFTETGPELEIRPMSETSFIYAADGTQIAAFYAQNRIVVPLDEIAPVMVDAMISIEDERFWEHGGVDIRGMVRAVANGGSQGASTLTQQYVKNILIDAALQDGDPFGVIEAREHTYMRKIREARMAMSLDETMTKEEILEGYLNIAQFGVKVFGVEAAAQHYFSKHASELTAVEAATIAGVTKAPGAYDPTRNPDNALKRRNTVLNKMWVLGKIDTDTYNQARSMSIAETLNITPVEIGCESAVGAEFFCDFVVKTIMTSPEFGATAAERSNLIYRGGLRIKTTLDRRMQEAAHMVVNRNIPADNEAYLDAVIVSVEPGTGYIKAMAQNKPMDNSPNPAPLTTSINYAADFPRGGSRGFQPGSQWKPFLLAEWLKTGHKISDYVYASQVTRIGSSFHASCPQAIRNISPWSPANTDGSIGGNISVLEATYKSVNTAFVDMASKLDLCSIADTAWKMGFRPTQTRTGDPVLTPSPDNITITPPMVIGVQETAPMSMAAAFATIASGGTFCLPTAITEVTKSDGTELPVPSAECDPEALPTNVANTMAAVMQNGLTRGTAYGNWLEDNRPAAGKTGTSQRSAQTWFTGFTPQLSTTVWVGEASGNASHLNINFYGRNFAPLYGSGLAAPTWRDYMDIAMRGMPIVDFPEPDLEMMGNIDWQAHIPEGHARAESPSDWNGHGNDALVDNSNVNPLVPTEQLADETTDEAED